MAEAVEDLVDVGRPQPIPDRHDPVQDAVVAFGIDDADLVVAIDQALDQAGGERRLARA